MLATRTLQARHGREFSTSECGEDSKTFVQASGAPRSIAIRNDDTMRRFLIEVEQFHSAALCPLAWT